MTTAALPFQILSVEEASTTLGVLPQTVRKWAADGRVQAQKRGRAWVVVMPIEVYAAHLLARVAKLAAENVLDGNEWSPADIVGIALGGLEVPESLDAAALQLAQLVADCTEQMKP